MTRQTTTTGGREATSAVIPGNGILNVGNPRTPVPAGYHWRALSDMARLESGHTPSRSRSDYWNGGVPWIGIKDATTHHGEIINSTFQEVSSLGVEKSSTRLLPAGTVCLSRTASVGYVVQTAVPMCTSQDFVNWVCGEALNPNYLRYALRSESESVRRWATGSTHQTLYYPEAKAIHLLTPERSVQDKVAEVLGALDDKIAANRRAIVAADRLITATVAPHLSNRFSLVTTIDIRFGEAFKGADFTSPGTGRPLIRIRDLKSQKCQVWTSEVRPRERVVEPGEVLVGMDAEFRATRWSGPAGLLNQRVMLIHSDRFGDGLVREMMRAPLERIERAKSGTTVIHLNKQDLEYEHVLAPDSSEIGRLRALVDPLWQRCIAAEKENHHLAATRDELLPLLMSGKITVKDAERRFGQEV